MLPTPAARPPLPHHHLYTPLSLTPAAVVGGSSLLCFFRAVNLWYERERPKKKNDTKCAYKRKNEPLAYSVANGILKRIGKQFASFLGANINHTVVHIAAY